MNRRQILLAAWASSLVLPALAASETPLDIVTQIYRVSAGKKGDYAGESAFSDKAIRASFFSRGFLAAVVKMEKKSASTNEPILDFDPVTASQDPSVKRLKIGTESAGADSGIVTATFYSFDNKQPTLVRYLFIMEAGQWKLDDIEGDVEGDKWSVRAITRN